MKFKKLLGAALVVAAVFSGTQTYAAPFGGFFARLFGARCCAQRYCACVAPSPCEVVRNNRTTPDCRAFGTCGVGSAEEYAPGWSSAEVVSPCDSVEALDVEIRGETPVEESDAVAPCAACSELEQRLIAAAIRARGRALLTDCRLCQWARRNSDLQARRGQVGHFVGGAWEIAAPGRTPEEAVQMWLNSPAHRRILLGGFTKVGAGAVRSANGTIFWTLRFE